MISQTQRKVITLLRNEGAYIRERIGGYEIGPRPPYTPKVMKTHLGEEGTAQFTVHTIVDGKTVEVQPIHDPFIHTTVTVGISRWGHFCAIFKRRKIKVQVVVRGSEGAERAIMTLDPKELEQETVEILRQRSICRESSTVGMNYSA